MRDTRWNSHAQHVERGHCSANFIYPMERTWRVRHVHNFTYLNLFVIIRFPPPLIFGWLRNKSNALLTVISALYAKLLVVMGLAFPMTEVISNHVPSFSYLVYSSPYIFFLLLSCEYLPKCRDFICTFILVPSPTSYLFSSPCWKIGQPRETVTLVRFRQFTCPFSLW